MRSIPLIERMFERKIDFLVVRLYLAYLAFTLLILPLLYLPYLIFTLLGVTKKPGSP